MKRLIFLLLIPFYVFSADRSVIPSVSDPRDLYSVSAALVIGEYSYGNGWPALPGVKKDVASVADSLKNSGFIVERINDADKKTLMSGLNTFLNKYASDPKARILVYFAGHGHTLENKNGRTGYVVLKNATDPSRNVQGFLNNSIEINYFANTAEKLKAKHTLFVFDSCFSGSIFSSMRSIPDFIMDMLKKRAREFIASGTENQQVPDESVFRSRFTSGISGAADANGDGLVTGSELGMYVQQEVSSYSGGTQTPVFGKLRDSDGEFVFFVNKPASQAQASSSSESSGEKERLLAVIRKAPGSKDANDALARLREIDDSLKNRPPVEAKERKDFTMTATSKKTVNVTVSDYPYVVIAPVDVEVNGKRIKAAFKVKAANDTAYRHLTQRREMLKSVIAKKIAENVSGDMNAADMRVAVKKAADDAVGLVCPSCAGDPSILIGLRLF